MNAKGLILIGVGLLLLGGGFYMYGKTRGLRNNNPGNIRASGSKWQGQSGVDDKGFVIFATPQDGIRALAKTLKTYQTKHGLKTITDMINRWAPPTENDTVSYVESVSNRVGIAPNQRFTFNNDILVKVVSAIIKHENGINPYDSETLNQGIKAS